VTGTAPILSIGVPVYNGDAYLAEALTSILDQSFRDFELILSDNASTDRTASIAQEFARRDSRVTIRRNDVNVGLSANFNLLVPLARGRYFKWASSDDVLRPGYLERCVEVLESRPGTVLVYTRAEFIDQAGRPFEKDDPGWHLVDDDPAERLRTVIRSGHMVNSILGVIRADALRRTRLLPRYPGGDYRVLGELSLLGTFVELSDPLYVRRIHAESSKGNTGNEAWLRQYWSGSRPGAGAPYWRLCGDHARTIVGSSLPWGAKASLLTHLGRVMTARRDRLFGELGSLVFSRKQP